MSVAVRTVSAKEDGWKMEERMSALSLAGDRRPQRARRPQGARSRPPQTPTIATTQRSASQRRPRHGENRWRREYSQTATTHKNNEQLGDSCPDDLLLELMGDNRGRSPASTTPLPFPGLLSHRQQQNFGKPAATHTPSPPTYHFSSSPSPETTHLPTITVTNPENMVLSQASPTLMYTPDVDIASPVCLSLPALLDAEKRLPDLQIRPSRRLVSRSGRRTQTPTVKLPAITSTGPSHHRTRSFSDGSIEKLPLLWKKL